MLRSMPKLFVIGSKYAHPKTLEIAAKIHKFWPKGFYLEYEVSLKSLLPEPKNSGFLGQILFCSGR